MKIIWIVPAVLILALLSRMSQISFSQTLKIDTSKKVVFQEVAVNWDSIAAEKQLKAYQDSVAYENDKSRDALNKRFEVTKIMTVNKKLANDVLQSLDHLEKLAEAQRMKLPEILVLKVNNIDPVMKVNLRQDTTSQTLWRRLLFMKNGNRKD